MEDIQIPYLLQQTTKDNTGSQLDKIRVHTERQESSQTVDLIVQPANCRPIPIQLLQSTPVARWGMRRDPFRPQQCQLQHRQQWGQQSQDRQPINILELLLIVAHLGPGRQQPVLHIRDSCSEIVSHFLKRRELNY